MNVFKLTIPADSIFVFLKSGSVDTTDQKQMLDLPK
jgi:hypothetical protein